MDGFWVVAGLVILIPTAIILFASPLRDPLAGIGGDRGKTMISVV